MALKGNAGFTYTPAGSTGRTLTMNWPMHLVPQDGSEARHNQFRRAVTSLNKKQREVWTIGGSSGGVEELLARIRFSDLGDGLLEMLRQGANGTQLNYFPDLARETSFPLELIDFADRVSVRHDEDRGMGEGEHQADFPVRSADGTPLWPLYVPVRFTGDGEENLLRDAAMDTDTDADGVVDGFEDVVSGTGFTFDVAASAGAGADTQRVQADGTGSDGDQAQLRQAALRVFPGDQVVASAQAWFSTLPTGAEGLMTLRFDGSDGTLISTESTVFTDGTIQRREVTAVAPEGAAQVQVVLRLRLTADNGDGIVRFHLARLLRASSDPATYANPHVSGGSQTGTSLDTAGWPASTTGVVKTGDVIRCGGSGETQALADDVTHFFRAAEDVNSDGNGDATIPLTRAIGSGNAPADGAALRLVHPVF